MIAGSYTVFIPWVARDSTAMLKNDELTVSIFTIMIWILDSCFCLFEFKHACTDNCPKHLWLILLPPLGYKIFNCSYRSLANLCKHYKLCNSILQAHMPHRTSTYHYTAKWRATTVTSFPKSSHHPNLCISRTCTSREQEKERKGMLSN